MVIASIINPTTAFMAAVAITALPSSNELLSVTTVLLVMIKGDLMRLLEVLCSGTTMGWRLREAINLLDTSCYPFTSDDRDSHIKHIARELHPLGPCDRFDAYFLLVDIEFFEGKALATPTAIA